MKNLVFLFSFVSIFLFGTCTTPADYNTTIMDEAVKIEKEAQKITERLQEKDLDGANIAYQEGLDQAKVSLKKLERMSTYEGDDALRQAAIEFLSFYDGLFKNEYKETFDILRKKKYNIEDGDRLFEIMDNISKRGIEAKKNLINEHFAFIKKYDLIVEKK